MMAFCRRRDRQDNLPIEEGKALPVLPFQSYYGLLSRAPTRLSPNLPRGRESGAVAEGT
jgi:hypothetical protein